MSPRVCYQTCVYLTRVPSPTESFANPQNFYFRQICLISNGQQTVVISRLSPILGCRKVNTHGGDGIDAAEAASNKAEAGQRR